MSSAILIESISYSLDISREASKAFLDKIDNNLGNLRSQLSRRVDAIMSESGSDADRADKLIQYSCSASTGLDKNALKLVIGFAGAFWGSGIVAAGINSAGAVAIAGLGVTVTPIIAILLGLVIMYISGSFAWGVLKEILGRIPNSLEEIQ